MAGSHRLWSALVLAVLLCGCATQSPPERGLSSAGLARIEKAVSADVDRGRIPGVVMMVQRDGRLVYSKTIGKQDPASGAPMQEDSIFRIYSMTKPIVSVGLTRL
jgi:CubicO group peptidase (beta-lactamase class C family)